jgi:tetratricopeptide (TPR) repeat protein
MDGSNQLETASQNVLNGTVSEADQEPVKNNQLAKTTVSRGEAHRRHTIYYQQVLEKVDELYRQGNPSLIEGLRLYDLELSNIQVGHDWVVSQRQQSQEIARLCIAYPNSAPHILLLRQHPKEYIRWHQTALSVAQLLNDRTNEGIHISSLGVACAELGEVRKAIEFYEQALIIDRETGDRHGEANVLGNLGVAYKNLGEVGKAIEFHEQHLAITQEIGDRRSEGNALGNLGLAYADLGETYKAIELIETALKIFEEIESPYANLARQWLDELRAG